MKHDLITPSKLSITLSTSYFSIRGGSVPIYSSYKTFSNIELVIHLPFLKLAFFALLFPLKSSFIFCFLNLHFFCQFFCLFFCKQFSFLLHLLRVILKKMLM